VDASEDPPDRGRPWAIGLSDRSVAPDPVTQFSRWLADARAAGLAEPTAMVLATASPGGVPRARTVLLKDYDHGGFVFYTNKTSRKGCELGANPRACLLFPWHAMRRQIIVEGTVTEVPDAQNERYFHSRPRGSQLGAWASRQSTVLTSRAELEDRFARLHDRWPEPAEVPLPPFWGGFLVTPAEVEFWQGRGDRLHDRLRYRRVNGGWVIERLAP
jgi:pyridoxamine 5'-phosphate oxidase